MDETLPASTLALELLKMNRDERDIKDDDKREAVKRCIGLLRERKDYVRRRNIAWF